MADMNGDTYTYSESTAQSNNQPVFTSKQWAYQIDQNNGSYGSKQIIFDLSGFYNSQRFINPQEMFMVLPVMTSMTSVSAYDIPNGLGAQPKIGAVADGKFNDNDGAVTNQYSMGFKSGFWHLINSIQIQVDGKDVIQLTPNIGYHASFVANTTWSRLDVEKHGATLGFHPDSCDSWKINHQGAFTEFGYGVCNNTLVSGNRYQSPYPGTDPAFKDAAIATTFKCAKSPFYPLHGLHQSQSVTSDVNSGFMQRMKTTNRYDPSKWVVGIPDTVPGGILTSAKYQSCVGVATTDKTLDRQMISQTMTINSTAHVIDPVGVGLAGDDCDCRKAFRQLATDCVIRFKDICDLFTKLPLTRGLYMRIIVNVNTGNMLVGAGGVLNSAAFCVDVAGVNTIDKVGVCARPVYSAIANSTFPTTCPIMLSAMQVSALSPANAAGSVLGNFPHMSNIQIYPGVAVDQGTQHRQGLLLSVSIGTADPIHKQSGLTLSELKNHPRLNCAVYAPIIDMEPALTNDYIVSQKNSAVYYRDVLAYSYPGVKSNGLMNYQVANGVVNMKRLIIIPFYHDDTNLATPGPASADAADHNVYGYANMSSIPFEPASPFGSAPATCAPQNSLTNFNVLISNMNVFQRNIDYSFENFIEEIAPANCINGGLDFGLQSGLIDYHAWMQNYRYYVVDLSRRLAGDNTPKSLTVIGTNSSKLTVDYYFFVEYERHLSLDVESGHISVSSN